MKVIKIVKRGWWFSTRDTVRLEATVDHCLTPRSYSFGRQWKIARYTKMTVTLPKEWKLQEGDLVSVTSLWRYHEDRFTSVNTRE